MQAELRACIEQEAKARGELREMEAAVKVLEQELATAGASISCCRTIVMAYTVMASAGMAYTFTVYTVMASTAMGHAAMAYIVMANTVMAHVIFA